MRDYLSQIAEQKAELMALLEKNEKQIKKAETFEERNIVINIEQAKHEVHERKIYVDKFIIEASHEAKVAVLEREREEITQDVQREFRKRLADMEVNILAYQDLLLTKDAELKILEAKLLNQDGAGPDQSALLSEIEQLKQLLISK